MFIQIKTAASQIYSKVSSDVQKRPWIILLILVAVSFLVFSTYSIDRYLALQSNFFDLGLVANSLWRTINGFESWPTLVLPSTTGHINHISPILGLAAIVYAVAPDPRTLLVLQAGILSTATIPLYFLTVRETRSQLAAILLSGLYLANPALHGIVRYDFHAEAFIPLFIFSIYYSYGSRKSWLFYLSTGLLLATIEYSAILGIGTAVSLLMVTKRLNRRILTVLIASLALLAIILFSTFEQGFQAIGWPPNWLAVQLSGNISSQPGGFTQYLGALVANPSILISSLQVDIFTKILYALVVTAPFWFAVVKYASRMIPALPWFIIVFATSRFSFTSFDFQYTAFVIPFVYLAAIPFMSRALRARKLLLGLVIIAICVMTVYSSLSPIGPHGQWPQPDPLTSKVTLLGNSLPLNATILTQSDLYPELANRPYVSLKFSPASPPQYILVNSQSPWYNWTDPALGYPLSARQQLGQLTQDYSYRLVESDQGIQLYELESALASPTSSPWS